MKLTHSIVAIATLSTLSFAGGDIDPITVFDTEPVVEIPVEPVIVPEPVVVTPPPVVVTPPAKVEVPPVLVVAEPLGLYIAGGLTGLAIRGDDRANIFSEEKTQDRQLGFTGRLGYDFMNYLGAELRGTYGFSKVASFADNYKQIGAYLKPNYDVTDDVNLYGLLGMSKTNGGGIPTGVDDTGLSYGLGLDYDLNDKVSVFTDVLNYIKKTDTTSQWGLTLGAAYNF